jgi:ABC-2 type transport system permease protein
MTGSVVASPAGRARPLPGALRLGLSRSVIEAKMFFREKDSMVFTFFFPVVLLFIFGSVFGKNEVAPGVSFKQYVAAAMIASGVVLSSFQQLAISIAIERDDQTLKRLRGTPMPAAAYFLGKIGMVLITSLIQLAVLLVCSRLLFGLKLPTSADLWLRFAWIFLLGVASGTVVGIAYSSVPRSAKSAGAVVSPVVIVLQFISGVFFVFSDLPSWMQNVASVFPLKWLTQGMRSVFLPDSFAAAEPTGSWQLPQIALILAGWTVVGLVLCRLTFRWQRRDAG